MENLKLLFSIIDLTTLSHSDTEKSVKALCDKSENKKLNLNVAGICIYPAYVSFVKENLPNKNIKTVSVIGGFPDSQTLLEVKILETQTAIKAGADEVDIVLPTGKWIDGKKTEIADEITEVKNICKETGTKLKVILETGYFDSQEEIAELSKFAINAGADFIKTSTGKNGKGATPEAVETMCKIIKEHYKNTGIKIGIKPSGGIRDVETALKYLEIVKNTLGEKWLIPELFRIGASSLLNDINQKLK